MTAQTSCLDFPATTRSMVPPVTIFSMAVPGNDVAFLGAGNDVFQWDPGDGNDMVEGQDGIDRLDFNGANIAENIDISANGGRVRFTRDVANVTMDLNDVELVRFKALGGADNIVINDLSGTDVVGPASMSILPATRAAATARWTGHGQRRGRQRDHHGLFEAPALSALMAPPRRWRSSMPKAATSWWSTAAPATTPSTPPASPRHDHSHPRRRRRRRHALRRPGQRDSSRRSGQRRAQRRHRSRHDEGRRGQRRLFRRQCRRCGGRERRRRQRYGFRDGRLRAVRRTWKTWSCKAAPTCRASATAWRTRIFGNTGNNLLDGGAGADAMTGGAGNDVYFRRQCRRRR